MCALKGQKPEWCVLSPGPTGRGETNLIFIFWALEKGRLLLKKFMPPEGQLGLLSPSGGDKRNFLFRSSVPSAGPAFRKKEER